MKKFKNSRTEISTTNPCYSSKLYATFLETQHPYIDLWTFNVRRTVEDLYAQENHGRRIFHIINHKRDIHAPPKLSRTPPSTMPY